jgi:hypothetical protein
MSRISPWETLHGKAMTSGGIGAVIASAGSFLVLPVA